MNGGVFVTPLGGCDFARPGAFCVLSGGVCLLHMCFALLHGGKERLFMPRIILEAAHLLKSFGDQTVLDVDQIRIFDGERLALLK